MSEISLTLENARKLIPRCHHPRVHTHTRAHTHTHTFNGVRDDRRTRGSKLSALDWAKKRRGCSEDHLLHSTWCMVKQRPPGWQVGLDELSGPQGKSPRGGPRGENSQTSRPQPNNNPQTSNQPQKPRDKTAAARPPTGRAPKGQTAGGTPGPAQTADGQTDRQTDRLTD